MAMTKPAQYIDVYLPSKLSFIDYYAAVLNSYKDCSFDASIDVLHEVCANSVKQASFESNLTIVSNVVPPISKVAKFKALVEVTSTVRGYALNETAKFGSTIDISNEVSGNAMRRRLLSDLEGMTLADINDITLQELYWIDKTV